MPDNPQDLIDKYGKFPARSVQRRLADALAERLRVNVGLISENKALKEQLGLAEVHVMKTEEQKQWTEREHGVECVVCPDCAFTFDINHEDMGGGWSCPACGEIALHDKLADMRKALAILWRYHNNEGGDNWEFVKEHTEAALAAAPGEPETQRPFTPRTDEPEHVSVEQLQEIGFPTDTPGEHETQEPSVPVRKRIEWARNLAFDLADHLDIALAALPAEEPQL